MEEAREVPDGTECFTMEKERFLEKQIRGGDVIAKKLK